MSKHKRNIRNLALLALSLSILGFFMDNVVRELSVFTNIFEISMMSTILFGVFSAVYFIISYLSEFFSNSTNELTIED